LKLLSFESFPASILQNRDLSFKPFLFFYRTLLLSRPDTISRQVLLLTEYFFLLTGAF
jgi:hypothetical protein